MAYLTLTSVTPTDGARNVPLNSNIMLTFNTLILAGSGTISISNNGDYNWLAIDIHSSQARISGNTLTLVPPADFQLGYTYQVLLHPGLILGVDGSTLKDPELINFQTEPPVGPRILTGTPDRDWLLGSNSNDVMDGNDGNDGLQGFGGNDVLQGGAGDDYLEGGDGDDSLDGGFGNDGLLDGDGNNVLHGADGNDRLTLSAGNGKSTAYGDDGLDYLESNGANDTLVGGNGNDYLLANIGATAGMGTVSLSGGAGDDQLFVYMGDYRGVHAVLDGGTGKNTYEFRGRTPDTPHAITDFQPGIDTIQLSYAALANPDSNPFGPAGYLRAEQRGGDTLILQDDDGAAGTQAGFQPFLLLKNVALASLSAADFLSMSPDGNTAGLRLQGGDGDDSFLGSIDGDRMNGGAGRDFLYGAGGADSLEGGLGTDYLRGGSGNDFLDGGAGSDDLDGGAGDDVLEGGDGNDFLAGGLGSDFISGGAGNDMMFGGSGSSKSPVNDGAGANVFMGGSGLDYAYLDRTFSQTRVSYADGWYRVEDVAGHLATNVLQGVERLVLLGADGMQTLAFDTDGNAGQLYRLYLAAFGHKPDDAGYAYWLKRADQGLSLDDIARQFTQTSEFTSVYGTGGNSAAFVNQLYQTVLHRAPDDAGKAYWVVALDQQRTTPAGLLRLFAESSEHVDAVSGLIGLGIKYDYFNPF